MEESNYTLADGSHFEIVNENGPKGAMTITVNATPTKNRDGSPKEHLYKAEIAYIKEFADTGDGGANWYAVGVSYNGESLCDATVRGKAAAKKVATAVIRRHIKSRVKQMRRHIGDKTMAARKRFEAARDALDSAQDRYEEAREKYYLMLEKRARFNTKGADYEQQ